MVIFKRKPTLMMQLIRVQNILLRVHITSKVWSLSKLSWLRICGSAWAPPYRDDSLPSLPPNIITRMHASIKSASLCVHPCGLNEHTKLKISRSIQSDKVSYQRSVDSKLQALFRGQFHLISFFKSSPLGWSILSFCTMYALEYRDYTYHERPIWM